VGTPQTLGIDGTKAIWNGVPAPGDTFTVPTAFMYPVRHLMIPSPSIVTRSKANSVEQVIDWIAPGVHGRFHVTGFALFGTRYRKAIVQISVPNYDGGAFPVGATDYIEFELFADATEVLTAVSVPNNQASVVPLILSVPWISHRWKPGPRTWFLGSLGDQAYKIIDSTENAVITDRDGTTPLTGGGTFVIFSDRMANLGTGSLNGTPVNLMTDNSGLYRFPKFIRLKIPTFLGDAEQSIVGTSRESGTAVFGTFVDWRPAGRNRFDQGFSWTPVPSTVTAKAASNVSSTEHLGRALIRTRMQYSEILADDRDQFLNAFLNEIRRPFAFFRDGDDTQSADYLQLVDGPEIVNTQGNRYSYTIEAEEVG
jgi:hypothetical protein